MGNYIAYKPTVRLETPASYKTKFAPYADVVICLTEVHYCPFCGGEVVSGARHTCCDKYANAFDKFAKQHGATNVVRYFVGDDLEEHGINLFRKSVTEIKSCLLRKSVIKEFGPDFWDFSEFYPVCGDKGFRLANPLFQGGVLKFYWKNLKTKRVFLCSLQDLQVGPHEKTFLMRVVWEGNKPNYETIMSFNDWNDFCEALKKV